MFFKRLAMLFYVTISLFLGSFILLYALNMIDYQGVSIVFSAAYFDPNLKMPLLIVAGIILFSNFLFYQFLSVNVRRDKIIAFDNPDGRVTVSLNAMEELLKKSLEKIPEVKDVRAAMAASRKGLDIKVRISLADEVNIPEITSIVQQRTKRKVQDMIGLEEPLNISVYVGKIQPDLHKSKTQDTDIADDDSSVHVPFHGYRA